ncbi:MAG: hypothetical protein QXU97_03435 [Fervidicoccaceae archaeon]
MKLRRRGKSEVLRKCSSCLHYKEKFRYCSFMKISVNGGAEACDHYAPRSAEAA